MLLFINLLYFFNSMSLAGNTRSPAVLDSSCDLNISSAPLRPLIEIHKEQCKRVRQCMNSAGDEEMQDLKKLEKLACQGEFPPVSTTIPTIKINKAELNDNSRREKQTNKESISNQPTSAVIEK